ncbi:MAG: OmpA family protein [Nitrospirae bacterium]|nr:OmpA family protein [Nitrospirota bacterium]
MSKKKHEEHENHERWLVSYADFITLLFAFFVVMYSVSSVNEGKFRTVSESIKAALHPIVSPHVSPTPFQVGHNASASISPNLAPSRDLAVRRLREVVKLLQSNGQSDRIRMIEKGDSDIVLSLPELVLFQAGEANLRAEAMPILQALAEVLIELDRQVKVQGHTDNVPIRTAQFPSNWELSAIRAVMVVRAMHELYGVPIQNLSAVGYADSQPVNDNATPANRAKNRRVEIVVQERKSESAPDRPAAVPAMAEGAEIAGSPEANSAAKGTDAAVEPAAGGVGLGAPGAGFPNRRP